MCTLFRTLLVVGVIMAAFGTQVVRADMDLGDKCNVLCKEKGMYFDPYGYSECRGDYCDCACVK